MLFALVPVAGAQEDYSACEFETYSAVEVIPGSLYLSMSYIDIPGRTDADVWVESNKVLGLQKKDTFCADGQFIPRDEPVAAELVKDTWQGHPTDSLEELL